MSRYADSISTPPKFNMEPEKKSPEKEDHSWKPSFSGSVLNFGRVYVHAVIAILLPIFESTKPLHTNTNAHIIYIYNKLSTYWNPSVVHFLLGSKKHQTSEFEPCKMPSIREIATPWDQGLTGPKPTTFRVFKDPKRDT